MIRCMTAFASFDVEVGRFTLILEVRSVNHRDLDVSPRVLAISILIEASVRAIVGQYHQRGTVDSNLT